MICFREDNIIVKIGLVLNLATLWQQKISKSK